MSTVHEAQRIGAPEDLPCRLESLGNFGVAAIQCKKWGGGGFPSRDGEVGRDEWRDVALALGPPRPGRVIAVTPASDSGAMRHFGPTSTPAQADGGGVHFRLFYFDGPAADVAEETLLLSGKGTSGDAVAADMRPA